MESMQSSNNPLGFILGIIFSLIEASRGKGMGAEVARKRNLNNKN